MGETNPNWREIRNLYEKVNDPFETMALQSVSNTLKLTSEDAESHFLVPTLYVGTHTPT